MSVEIIEGDALTVLQGIPAQSVQTCITSPPYFGLRDYQSEGQIGLEPTPDAYVARLVEVFREVKRVLRSDGTLWLNLGDSYAGSSQNGGDGTTSTLTKGGKVQAQYGQVHGFRRGDGTAKPKDLLGIPWMVAFALRADGWYLRSEVIWAKPNPMPESVTDRPTKAHEQVFLLSKQPRYFYDGDAIRDAPTGRTDPMRFTGTAASHNGAKRQDVGRTQELDGTVGRNKRSVWTIATAPYPNAHFATFPPKLIEPMVLAGCPREACGVCGAPWEREVEREPGFQARRNYEQGTRGRRTGAATDADYRGVGLTRAKTLGFRPTCDHDPTATMPGTVLDCFAGSGTTLQVALANGRSAIGIELNPEYGELMRRRLVGVTPSMFDTEVDSADARQNKWDREGR